jgi:hypothetical protein
VHHVFAVIPSVTISFFGLFLLGSKLDRDVEPVPQRRLGPRQPILDLFDLKLGAPPFTNTKNRIASSTKANEFE